MSLEAIRLVDQSQKRAEELLAEMTAEARTIVSEAEAEGKNLLSEIRRTAAGDHAAAMEKAKAEANQKTQAVLDETKAKADQLKQQAEEKLPKAVSLIEERVVNG